MMSFLSRSFVCLAIVCLAVGCGSSAPSADGKPAPDSGQGTGPDAVSLSGLGPDRTLNTLGHDEVAALCLAISPLAARVAGDPSLSRGSCILRIIQRHFVRQLTTIDECQRAMVACDDGSAMASGGASTGALPSLLEAGLACSTSVQDIDPGCRAKVGEVEGCLLAGLGVLPLANATTCEPIVSGEASRQVAQALGNQGVLSCQGYQSKCPDGLFGPVADAGS